MSSSNQNRISDCHVSNMSLETIKLILMDDNLEVKSELEVCEMLMRWLQAQREAGHEVHPDQLLPLIRWSGISIDYVKSKLLQNTTLTTDPASISFLIKVITYLLLDTQFEGLRTFHRASTGLENGLMIVGPFYGYAATSEVSYISHQHPNRVTLLAAIPTKMTPGSSACLFNNNVYVTAAGDHPCNETWTWNILSRWNRCADMLIGRVHHSAVVINSMLYVLGGWIRADNTTLSSAECYNTKTNKWYSAGRLVHAVKHAACITYNNNIYLFGGLDKYDQPVPHVQIYNPAQERCTLLEQPMPRAYYHTMRAVLWDTSVILLGRHTCFTYNFETEIWQEREQFKTNVGYFALTLDNSRVYVAGGGINSIDKDNKVNWTLADEIKSASVLDIIQDKPAAWKPHAKLIKPAMISSFISISLPL